MGTPSETRYVARSPNVSAELFEIGQELVKPTSHPFRSTTGGRVEPDGTACRGCTTMVKAACRSSPASLLADSVTVYSPGFARRDAASRIPSPALLGPATRPSACAP